MGSQKSFTFLVTLLSMRCLFGRTGRGTERGRVGFCPCVLVVRNRSQFKRCKWKKQKNTRKTTINCVRDTLDRDWPSGSNGGCEGYIWIQRRTLKDPHRVFGDDPLRKLKSWGVPVCVTFDLISVLPRCTFRPLSQIPLLRYSTHLLTFGHFLLWTRRFVPNPWSCHRRTYLL